MMADEDMKLSLYTLGIVVVYTIVAVLSPVAAIAATLPCCAALILPTVVHLRHRQRKARRGRNRTRAA